MDTYGWPENVVCWDAYLLTSYGWPGGAGCWDAELLTSFGLAENVGANLLTSYGGMGVQAVGMQSCSPAAGAGGRRIWAVEMLSVLAVLTKQHMI